ncbi:MAG: exodeoxyribonuclease VII small subunit [Clostridia bacterium]|nr:exodeoxyribonuclease VII small subunit [Clostridia bacterium]
MKAEESVKRLEEIAKALESQDLDIERATKLFEEGVSIIKENYEQLKSASAKVTILKNELDKYSEIKFDCFDEDK